MKKGLWPLTFGVLFLLYQIFGVSGGYFDDLGVYYVLFSPFSEITTDAVWIHYILTYITGVLGILLLIWGFQAFIKDSPESLNTNRMVKSYRAIKDTRTLAQCAVLVALYVVLDMMPKFPYLEITFAFVALAGIAYIAGPISGFFCGGVCEILGYLLAPKTGPLHLGFTFTAMLTGFVMGCFLYERDLNVWRVIISRSIVAVFLNLGLNTYWLSDIYGEGYLVLIPSRAVKLLQLPIDVFLIFLILKLIAKINKDKKINKKH
ncbi:MAG: folate family ECF transporter S component [Clostridia bacterium]|nr:folate family ECF transporter S component [Clostridia bacterium]